MINAVADSRPLIFGEVLFDAFPDGREVLGGAPFNVAWHLKGLGLDPLMISAVGDDGRGREILARMAAWGLDRSGIQIDPDHRTGEVRVTIEQDEPRFEVLPDRAFDFIEPDRSIALLADARPALIYHGSLASRGAVSGRSLELLVHAAQCPVFFDVNLRDPWWTPGLVRSLMHNARWVKLNVDELRRLATAEPAIEAAALALLREHGRLELVVVTLGAEGALLVSDPGVLSGRPLPDVRVVDTVGAGDAFSAALIAGLLKNQDSALTLKRAIALAGRVCAMQGATAADPGLYSGLY